MNVKKAAILKTRELSLLEKIIKKNQKRYKPQRIFLLVPKNYKVEKIPDNRLWKTPIRGFNPLSLLINPRLFFEFRSFDLLFVPHFNWFGKGTTQLEIFAYFLGAKKTIAYSVSHIEYGVNFLTILKRVRSNTHILLLKYLKLGEILNSIYQELIFANRIINENKIKKGENTVIRTNAQFNSPENLKIGENSDINRSFSVLGRGKVKIGNFVHIGPNVTILTANHYMWEKDLDAFPTYTKDVEIGDNVWIGDHAIILPGVKIGNDAIVGAGSVVTKDIPDGKIVVGNPAKVIKERPEKKPKEIVV